MWLLSDTSASMFPSLTVPFRLFSLIPLRRRRVLSLHSSNDNPEVLSVTAVDVHGVGLGPEKPGTDRCDSR
jgi:hypothetical protein